MYKLKLLLIWLIAFFAYSCKEKPLDIDGDGVVDMIDNVIVDLCPTIKGDSISMGCPDIKKINFYIETSASMNGYFNGKTEFKDNLSSTISKIEGFIQPEVPDNVNIYFIDSADSPRLYKGEKSTFFHSISSTNISTGRSSEMHDIFNKITDTNNLASNSISILISDCILSYPDSKIKLNREINKDNATSGLKNDIETIFTPLAYKRIDCAVFQYFSTFDGTYYNYRNEKTKIKSSTRPYYIWLFGQKNNLQYFLDKADMKSSNMLTFRSLEEQKNIVSLFDNINDYQEDYKLDIGKYEIEEENEIRIINFSQENNVAIFLSLDTKSLSQFEKEFISNHCNDFIYSDSKNIIDCSLPNKSEISSINQLLTDFQLSNNDKLFIKIIVSKFDKENIELELKIPHIYNNWYKKISIMDDTNLDSIKGKTFAVEHLIDGVINAYNSNSKFRFIKKIKINN